MVATYDFFPEQEVSNAIKLSTVSGRFNVTILAAVCSKTPRCTAFNTLGALMTAPPRHVLSYLDNTKVSACDGVYVSNRTVTGLDLQVTGPRASGLQHNFSKRNPFHLRRPCAPIDIALPPRLGLHFTLHMSGYNIRLNDIERRVKHKKRWSRLPGQNLPPAAHGLRLSTHAP